MDIAFATAVDRAKLLPNDDGEPVAFHTLRHTFASHYTTEVYRHRARSSARGESLGSHRSR